MKPVRAFAAEDGTLHATVGAARQHELEGQLRGVALTEGCTIAGDTNGLTATQAEELAKWLVANSVSVVQLLRKGGVTGTPRTTTKPHKRTTKPLAVAA